MTSWGIVVKASNSRRYSKTFYLKTLNFFYTSHHHTKLMGSRGYPKHFSFWFPIHVNFMIRHKFVLRPRLGRNISRIHANIAPSYNNKAPLTKIHASAPDHIYIYPRINFTTSMRKIHPVRILSSLSTLFRPRSSWRSMFFHDLSMQSTLLLDLSTWSNDILNLSTFCDWWCLEIHSDLSVLRLGFSLLSLLFLGASNISVLFLDGSNWSTLFLVLVLCHGDRSTVATNFLRCLMYSG